MEKRAYTRASHFTGNVVNHAKHRKIAVGLHAACSARYLATKTMFGLFARARLALRENDAVFSSWSARWRALAARAVRERNRALFLCGERWRAMSTSALARAVELRQRSMFEKPTCGIDDAMFGAPIFYCHNLVWFLQKMSVCAHCKKSDYMSRYMNCLATDKRRARFFMRCDGCRVVQYCSRECQQSDWAVHRTHCTMRTGQLRRHTLLRKFLWWFSRHSYDGHWCTDDGSGRVQATRCDADCFYPHFWWWAGVKREMTALGAHTAIVRIVAGMPPADASTGHAERMQMEARQWDVDVSHFEREDAWLRWRPMHVSDARRVLPAAPRHVWHLILRESARHTMFVWRDASSQWHYELLLLEHGECDSD